MWIDIELERLRKAPWNYKRSTATEERTKEALKNNMVQNGQVENIIVRELEDGYFEIVNGNHRFDVMRELNYDICHCFNVGNISLSQAKLLAVQTNETKFQSDEQALESLIQDLRNEFSIETITESLPFEESFFDNIFYEERQQDNSIANPIESEGVDTFKTTNLKFSNEENREEFKNRLREMRSDENSSVPIGDLLLQYLRNI